MMSRDYAVTVQIDGATVYQGTPDTNGGNCVALGNGAGGLVFDLATLRAYLRRRIRTHGLVAASVAAAVHSGALAIPDADRARGDGKVRRRPQLVPIVVRPHSSRQPREPPALRP